MSNLQQPNPPAAPTEPELDTRAVEFLTQECERMLSLYSQAQSNAQSVFNFYLTFVTTVVGGVVIFLQLGADDLAQTRLIIGGLLFFSVVVGSVYLSALSGRYAHAARYAQAVDGIRIFLIDRLHVPVPPIYEPFLKPLISTKPTRFQKVWSMVIWVFPTGTYQMFMAIVNSASFALVTWLVFSSVGAELIRAIIAVLLVFLITLGIYNVYSRLVIRRFGSRLNVDLSNDLPAWAAHE